MREGAVVALVSDAGMPVISDPASARAGRASPPGSPVEVLPGPSAALAALVASGLPADAWHFVGFLPRKRAELERLFAATAETLVAFESPRRVAASLAVLASLDPDRPVAVARELTKVHEEVVRGTLPRVRPALRGVPAARGGRAGRGPLRPRARRTSSPAVAALRRLVEAGADAPRPAASGRRVDGRAGQRVVRGLQALVPASTVPAEQQASPSSQCPRLAGAALLPAAHCVLAEPPDPHAGFSGRPNYDICSIRAVHGGLRARPRTPSSQLRRTRSIGGPRPYGRPRHARHPPHPRPSGHDAVAASLVALAAVPVVIAGVALTAAASLPLLIPAPRRARPRFRFYACPRWSR